MDRSRVHPIVGGWSYWTFEVELEGPDEQAESFEPCWIFRFPRNSVVAGNLQKEQAVLPVVAPQVDFAVPRFEHVGTWNGQPYAGYRRIPGQPLSSLPNFRSKLPDEAAGPIAAALSLLHDIPTSLVAGACSVEPTVDAWRQRYYELRDTVRARISPLLDSRVLDAVERGFERFFREELATLEDVALVHCDLSCEHILIGDDGSSVTGLIDFEDATIGDPAIDLVGIYVTYGMETVEKVLDCYQRALDVQRTLDEHFEQRLRFYTWMASCHELLYGLEEGREDPVEDGIEGLRLRLGNAGLF